MRWMVEIIDISSDERLLKDVLKSLKMELCQENNVTYLIGDQFEAQSTSSEVWQLAERTRDVLYEVSANILGFKLAKLHEHKEDGSWNQYLFLSGVIEIGSSSSFDLTIDLAKDVSEEDLEAECQEYEYQEKLSFLSCRFSAAFWDEHARKVNRLLQQELSWARMYLIFELLEADLKKNRKKLESLAPKPYWDRFTHSANYPQKSGNDSRHIVPKPKQKPPLNPMLEEEAQNFISRAANLWFKQKYADNNNGYNSMSAVVPSLTSETES